MSTASFDKAFVVEDRESQERLYKILESDSPSIPLSNPIDTFKELSRSEELLKRYLCRLKG